ncbi:MAG: Trk system potassium transporter TrkA [Candidatus Lindowbacteria bacterium]|nr:Trk system potassium transporter TrkA [Candidatus Lindowbacteria bacterium]
MNVIVVGGGDVGFQVARVLAAEKQDVTLIEPDEERRAWVQSKLDILTVAGSGSSPSALEEAGIEKADLLIASANLDEVNMIACAYAKSYDVGLTLARIQDPAYAGQTELFAKQLGVDHVIRPDDAAVIEIARLLEHTWAIDAAEFVDGKVEMMAIRLSDEDLIVGKSVAEIGASEISRSTIVASIYRNKELIVPHGDTVFADDDVVYFIGLKGSMSAISLLCGHPDEGADTITIYGGDTLGRNLAKALTDRKMTVTIIEPNAELAETCASELDRILVIQGDATDAKLLRDENIDESDGFVATTALDETNLLSSALVQRMGVPKTIALLVREDYAMLASEMGISATVSTESATADAILRFVRKGAMHTVTTILGGAAEFYELSIPDNDEIVGKPLSELNLPEGILIGAVARKDGSVEIPRGDTILNAGEIAVIITPADAVSAVETLFAEDTKTKKKKEKKRAAV